jgi:adenine-specific DNA-methyltransferase
MQINKIHNIDCRDGFDEIEPGTIDCIITDPPYLEEVFTSAYSTLAEGANRILKPGGFVASYCGIYFLPRVLAIFEGVQGLQYWWTYAQLNGPGQPRPMMWHKKSINSWKPVIIYSKGKARSPEGYYFDVISGRSEKLYHQWQQSISEAIALIRRFCPEGGTVCDPFCGSGTVPLAAKLLNRDFIGFEINPLTHQTACRRLEQEPIGLIVGS